MTPLTEQERQVLALAAGGLTQAAIAEKLGVSEATVSARAKSAAVKLGAKNLTEAVARALRRGLIDGDEEAGA